MTSTQSSHVVGRWLRRSRREGGGIQSRNIQNTKRRDVGGTLSDAIATATVCRCASTIVELAAASPWIAFEVSQLAARGISIRYFSAQTHHHHHHHHSPHHCPLQYCPHFNRRSPDRNDRLEMITTPNFSWWVASVPLPILLAILWAFEALHTTKQNKLRTHFTLRKPTKRGSQVAYL